MELPSTQSSELHIFGSEAPQIPLQSFSILSIRFF